jgi:2-polyprenyl-6-methoxyphenol hydroxylase-like FAD-dependent oxidoreductase
MIRSTAPSPDIAIVGGGIAGLALGRQLSMLGIEASLYERRPDPLDMGLAVNLPGTAVRALGMLGLGEALAAAGHPLRRREYRSDRDRLLFAVDEDAFWGPNARPHGIHRAALLRMLAADQRIDAGVGVDAIAIGAGSVQVRLSDGTEVRPHLLVGADGVRSRVREQIFGAADPSRAMLAQASWRFTTANPGIDCWTLWVGADAMILLMPVSEHEVYGWATLTGTDSSSASTGQLLRRFGTFPRHVRDTIERAMAAPGGLHHSPLEEVRLPGWVRNRVVLIGDAAHATAPVWAEGVAMAIEDAIVLGNCIAEAGDPADALVAYERRRRPRVNHVQKITDAMSKAVGLPPWLRRLIMPVLGPIRYRQAYGLLRAHP